MSKTFQIFDGKAHWLTPFESVEEAYSVYPSTILFVEAPDEVQEGWLYDAETGDFTEPPEPVYTPSAEELIAAFLEGYNGQS